VIDNVIIPPSKSVVELAVESPFHTTLVSVLTSPDYKPVLQALSGAGPFTVFAPTDDAFAAAGVDVSNVAAVTDVLKYHVLSGAVFSDDLSDGLKAPTLNGKDITVSLDGGVKINDANVIGADVKAINGVVHIIDKVLLPPVEIALPSIQDPPTAAPAPTAAPVAKSTPSPVPAFNSYNWGYPTYNRFSAGISTYGYSPYQTTYQSPYSSYTYGAYSPYATNYAPNYGGFNYGYSAQPAYSYGQNMNFNYGLPYNYGANYGYTSPYFLG